MKIIINGNKKWELKRTYYTLLKKRIFIETNIVLYYLHAWGKIITRDRIDSCSVFPSADFSTFYDLKITVFFTILLTRQDISQHLQELFELCVCGKSHLKKCSLNTFMSTLLILSTCWYSPP